MTAKKNASKPWGIIAILYIGLIAALGTYALPLLRVKLPPVGEKAWSIMDVTKMLPKMTQSKPSEDKNVFGVKTDFDFMDLLEKVAPKNSANQPSKVSPVFILGVLVPVSLVLTYVFMVLGLLLAPWAAALGWVTGFSVLTSLYALGGTFYLGKSASQVFHESVSKAAEGIFGGIAKNFVPEITIQPDTALYALAVLSILIFLINRFTRQKA